MLRITISDLLTIGVHVSPAEGVALTLAVADALADSGVHAMPPDEHVLLSSNGHVVLENVSVSTENSVDEPGKQHGAADLAAMLHRLLQLDGDMSNDRRSRVPGGLLVLLARALGRIDLEPLELSEFLAALARFGTPEATTIAAIFWRAARHRLPAGTARPQPDGVVPTRGEWTDRRRRTPAASELRRYLRDMERELYETRTVVTSAAPAATPPPPATAAVASPTPVRVGARRRRGLLRIGTGVAATIIGGVLGTLAAFSLSGNLEFASPSAVPSTPVPVSMMGVQNTDSAASTSMTGDARQASRPSRPIKTTRSVQPLLLAAAVGAEVFSPSFSPKGRAILFHTGRTASPLMRASMSDAGEVQQVEKLVDDGAANYHVVMSPDGELIAYDSDREGVRGVYVANSDGTNPRRISGTGHSLVPSWCPDGTRVAFVRAEPHRPRVWNIWIADLESGELERITDHDLGQPWGASWFPDGRRLAYSVEDRLMVADLESGMARGYRSPREGHLVRTPAVSPDGRQIVFQVQRDGVWLLDVERARMRKILKDATAEEFVWSPGGDAIAYHARTGGSYGLWRLALNGGAN
jgi:Tol biopolymer transport system component